METSFVNSESRFSVMGDGSLRGGGGMDYQAFMYGARSRRSIKREDCKEGYKLPHRLIEKKRRDRINECIVQLKELLPENLKLATLGHLEKAVVLELTVQHMQALTALSQQQKEHIAALQSGEATAATGSSSSPPSSSPPSTPLSSSLSYSAGYESCAREVMSYLGRTERASGPRLLSHLQRAVGHVELDTSPPAENNNHHQQQQQQLMPAKVQYLQQRAQQSHFSSSGSSSGSSDSSGSSSSSGGDDELAPRRNCVPVIQRACAAAAAGGDASGSDDTDTDSGYGGEGAGPSPAEPSGVGERTTPPPPPPPPPPPRVKREGDAPEAPCGGTVAKRPRPSSPPTERPRAGAVPRGQQQQQQQLTPPPPPPPPHPALCLPFYLFPPSAAYLQLLREKSGLREYAWPTQPFPFAYGPQQPAPRPVSPHRGD
uniref:Class E basic helix-loop-helix protein 41-like isoform X2 n=1 Tax=Petromyzon marinus TaxID=7757 RepID=A0AAJ7X307_PETMA|nr:class E basic helix-loop-helix protein 41-like isoform X2 [Petromyzon marinus]